MAAGKAMAVWVWVGSLYLSFLAILGKSGGIKIHAARA